jgi:rubredoxin
MFMAKTTTTSKKKGVKPATKPVAKKTTGSKVTSVPAQKQTAGRKTTAGKMTGQSALKTAKTGKTRPVSGKSPKKTMQSSSKAMARYKCKLCGYVYSPLRGEPHNGIPRGTPFDDLPETYVCPICGMEGKGKIGKWGFEEWRPTRYVCSMCNYVYDEKRGEPHRNIKPGTKFEDLPDTYVCPVCALDPKITLQFGKVLKQGFEPID